jgi:phage-related minor tail protein
LSTKVISAVLSLKDKNFSSGLKDAAGGVTDFQRKVQKTKNDIKSFSDSSVASFKTVSGAIAGLAASGMVVLGAAVGSSVIEMDSAFSRLEARTGATGAKLQGLESVTKEVFTNGFGENISLVADDVSKLGAMFGDLNKNELGELAKGAFTISDVWGAEVSEVGKTIKALTANFKGLSNSDAMDLMTTAFQKTGDYSDDLLDTFNEYSMHFSKLGLSAQDFTGILIKGAEAGAFNMDKVGDAVKEFGIRAIDGSKTTSEGFKAIGLKADDMAKKFGQGGESAQNAFNATIAGLAAMKDPVKRNAAGVALFGTQWEDLRDNVILSMADGASAVKGFQGATDRAAKAAKDNFGSKMKTTWRELKVGMADAFNDAGGEKVLTGLATKAKELVPHIKNIVTNATDLSTTIKDNWPIISNVLVGVGTFIGVLAAVKTGIAMVTAVQWLWNTAMAANPITWVVLGIAALVAIGVVLYKNWDTVEKKAGQLWQGIKTYFGGIKDAATEKLEPVITFFKDMGAAWDKFKDSISNFKMPKFGLPKWMGGNGLIQKADGSHATGLANVPFDNYRAILHKGEAVLTAKQANSLREAGMLQENGSGTPNLNMGKGDSPAGNTINNTSSNDNKRVILNVYPQGLTVKEVLDELVPQLEMALANM